jgi:hypothetical protein
MSSLPFALAHHSIMIGLDTFPISMVEDTQTTGSDKQGSECGGQSVCPCHPYIAWQFAYLW